MEREESCVSQQVWPGTQCEGRVFCPMPRDALQQELRVQGKWPVHGGRSPCSHESVLVEAQEQSRAPGNGKKPLCSPNKHFIGRGGNG